MIDTQKGHAGKDPPVDLHYCYRTESVPALYLSLARRAFNAICGVTPLLKITPQLHHHGGSIQNTAHRHRQLQERDRRMDYTSRTHKRMASASTRDGRAVRDLPRRNRARHDNTGRLHVESLRRTIFSTRL